MAGYSGMILTKAGLQLQAQAQIGGELRITKMAVGDGILASGESVENLTSLKNQVISLGIQDMKVTDDGQSRIRALLTNDSVTTGFFVREVGVFAKIGDSGAETLYSYTNANDKADYLPSKGINVVEEVLEVYIIVGNAQNVTCNINDRVTLATKKDVTDHTSNTDNPHNMVASQLPNSLISGLLTTDVQSTLAAIYTESTKKGSGARNVAITGPTDSRGEANVLRDRYGDNLCIGGAAISGGDYAGYPKENAFDSFTGSFWLSSQVTGAISAASYLGYQFSQAKVIRRMVLTQGAGHAIASVKVQHSADGSSWSDAATAFIVQGRNVISIGSVTASKYWRILANGNITTVGTAWAISALEMYEIANAELTDSDIVIQANALISMAAGFDLTKKQQVDYYEVTQQMPLTLAAADGYTVPLSYTDDLCNGGTVISSTPYSGYPAAAAFDNDATSYFQANETAANQSGVTYLGYDFGVGVTRSIRRIKMVAGNGPTGSALTLPFKVQKADTAAGPWTDVALGLMAPKALLDGPTYYTLPPVGAARCWRIIATGNITTGYAWDCWEMEMYEALQTHYVYATRDANGTVTVGSTRNKPRTAKPVTATTSGTQGYYTADVCTGGTAISSGGYGGSTAAMSFDNDVATTWSSAQLTPNLLGTAYIGYNFGTPKAIRKLLLSTHAVNGYNVTSAKVQYSDNGTSWTDAVTASQTYGTNYITIPSVGAHQYWRILANSANRIDGTAGNCWIVQEVEMYEYVESINSGVQIDDTTYGDNLCVGGAAISGGDSAGYSKEQAFDRNQTTTWSSSQLASAGVGVANVGYDFGVSRHIRQIIITADTYSPSNIKIQRSTDGTTWADVKTVGLATGTNAVDLPTSTASRFWRLLANGGRIDGATSASSYFGILDITMHEVSTDVNMYDAVAGVFKHYDGSTWDNVVRVFIGEAVVDTAGKVVSYTTYPYNKAKLKALPAEDSDDVVTLGQLTALLTTDGWLKIPVMVNGVKVDFILQWGNINSSAEYTTTLPILFPSEFLGLVVCNGYTAGSGVVGYIAGSPSSLYAFTSKGLNAGLGGRYIAIGK